jgi:hypothetical protein
MIKLIEGGNVFKDADGTPLTQRINQADVPATIKWVEKVTGIKFPPERWLGSTGRKATSGDLDLAVDINQISKEDLAALLTQFVQKNKQDPRTFVKKGGEVHLRTPIAGNVKNGFVQTDFMFFPNLDWGTFYYGGAENSAYKGMNRNVLMSSIAKQAGLKVGANGMFSRTTNQLVDGGMDPDYVAQVLLGPRATRDNLRNVESIYSALARDPRRDAKLADFREYLSREGLEEPTLKEASDVSFMARLRDRIVNQGMYKLIEDTMLTEDEVKGGKAKGIEHLEDLVFRKGSRGIREALAIVAAVGQDPSTTTVKWDGKPAIIFGRKADGTFILTDVAGFTAKGYDGLFSSPQKIAQQMAARDAAAAAKGNAATRTQQLTPIYAQLWPKLEASLPKNFRGYIQGDLLYMSTPTLEAGNYVFMPNTIEYRIPAASEVGRRIGASEEGVAVHTYYDEPGAPKQPVTPGLMGKLKSVPGLLLIEPVIPQKPVKPQSTKIKALKQLLSQHGAQIDQLFNPAELRQLQITDLPALCVDYINSIVANPNVTGFENLLSGFGAYLQNKVSPRKYNNIVEYLQSPRSNTEGISAAFSAFVLLHDIKTDLQQGLDLQHPGQEGWVFSTPAGVAKAVNRFDFSRANRAKNNPA